MEAAITERTAAILLEPIQGESGIIPATAEFLRGLRRLCDERDLLLMFDEIQCGFGRTGDWCGWRSLGAPEVEPDAISWAKGMAGSFPMGAIWARDRAVTLPDGTGRSARRSARARLATARLSAASRWAARRHWRRFDIIEEEELLANAARRRPAAPRKLLQALGFPADRGGAGSRPDDRRRTRRGGGCRDAGFQGDRERPPSLAARGPAAGGRACSRCPRARTSCAGCRR